MKKCAKIIALSLVAVLALAVLVACAPNSDPDKAVKALEKNGYTAAKDETIIPAALRLLGVKDIDCVISGTKTEDDKTETVTVIYFGSADAAKDAWDEVQKYAEDKKDDDEKDSDWVCKQSGAMIYYGTKAGVKAAR